jgi:hypothetical protein
MTYLHPLADTSHASEKTFACHWTKSTGFKWKDKAWESVEFDIKDRKPFFIKISNSNVDLKSVAAATYADIRETLYVSNPAEWDALLERERKHWSCSKDSREYPRTFGLVTKGPYIIHSCLSSSSGASLIFGETTREGAVARPFGITVPPSKSEKIGRDTISMDLFTCERM